MNDSTKEEFWSRCIIEGIKDKAKDYDKVI